MKPLLFAALVVFITGCTTDVGQPTYQAALNGTINDPELLSKACGREISQMDANSAAFSTKFSDFSSKRGVFAKDGTGQVSFTYTPKSGAPCSADLTFSFHQETEMKRFAKRNVAYTSTIELTDVTVTAK
jgi:hypothetical protein